MSVYSNEVTIELLRLQPPKTRSTHQNFLKHYRAGISDYQIAEKLGVAPSTVKRWRGNLGLPPNGKGGRRRR